MSERDRVRRGREGEREGQSKTEVERERGGEREGQSKTEVERERESDRGRKRESKTDREKRHNSSSICLRVGNTFFPLLSPFFISPR